MTTTASRPTSGTETRERWVNVEKPLQSWQGLVVEQTATTITLDEWTAWHMGDNRPTHARHGEQVEIQIDADTKIAEDEDDEPTSEPSADEDTETVEARDLRETDYVQAWTDINEELILATEEKNRDVADVILLAMDTASEEASRIAQDADHQDDSFDPAWCEDAVKAYRRVRPAPVTETVEGFPHFSGGFCDDRHCAGSTAATYDGHWVWKTAEAWARDHHTDGEECPSPNGCDDPGCRKTAQQTQAPDLPASDPNLRSFKFFLAGAGGVETIRSLFTGRPRVIGDGNNRASMLDLELGFPAFCMADVQAERANAARQKRPTRLVLDDFASTEYAD